MLTKAKTGTNAKQRCLSVYGVNLWNGLEIEMKECNTLNRLKKKIKNRMINKER